MKKIDIEQQLKSIQSAKTMQDRFDALQLIMRSFGYDKTAYSLVTDHPSMGLERNHGFIGDFPDDWLKHYVSEGLFEIDPVPDRIQKSSMPFYWSHLVNKDLISNDAYEMMQQAGHAGLNDGAVVPLYNKGGEIASIAMARQDQLGNNSYEDLAAMQILSTYFHECYRAEIKQDPIKELTEKELDVLRLAVQSKSDSEIADILYISCPTVRYRWNNIFRKLNAFGRMYAISKAIYLGYVSPVVTVKNYQG